jgi:peroxiredoxin
VRGVPGAGGGHALTMGVVRRLLVAGLVVAGVWAGVAAAQPGSLEALLQDFGLRPLSGNPPAFTLLGLDGERHDLEGLKGRVGFLYFWATWCPHCSRELPASIEKLHRELGARGLTIWAIDIAEPPEHVASWVKQRGISVPVLLDTDGVVTRAYRVTGTPTVVLLGRDGQWVGRGVGSRDWDGEGRPILTTLLARRP